MSEYTPAQAMNPDESQSTPSNQLSEGSQGGLTRVAIWVDNRHLAFKILSAGMIVMLLWAGSYKLTAPGADGIVPLVSNSPLLWWHFKVFGPYIGSDIIGLTEFTAAILYIVVYLKPKAGIVAGLITTLMFFTTSTMVCDDAWRNHFRSWHSRHEIFEQRGSISLQRCHCARSVLIPNRILWP